MPKHADCNAIGTTASSCNRLVGVKKQAGWTVSMNGNGLAAYSNTADLINTDAAWAVARAWQVLREPGGRREWCWQRGNSVGTFRVKYSASARFILGSPSPTATPSAADEIVLCGGGTDAAPTYGNIWSSNENSYRVHCVAWSTPVNGVYPFCSYALFTPSMAYAFGFAMQEPLAAGTYDPSEEDPCVVCAAGGQNAPASVFGWLAYNTGSQVAAVMTMNLGNFNSNLAVDMRSGKDPFTRVVYSAANGGTRIKGAGNQCAFIKGVNRAYPHTINRTSDALVYGATTTSHLLPFADNTEPLP